MLKEGLEIELVQLYLKQALKLVVLFFSNYLQGWLNKYLILISVFLLFTVMAQQLLTTTPLEMGLQMHNITTDVS